MSQEDQNPNLENAGGTDGEAPEVQQAPQQVSLRPAVLEEMQRLRSDVHRRDEELHALRIATLQSAVPRVDPIQAALQRVEKETDPDAFKYIAPALKPILEELASQRALNQQLQSNVQFLAQRDHERETHTQLSQFIPDLDVLGPRLLELVEKLPANVKKQYIDNPALFIPLADAVRNQSATGVARNRGARAATVMDTGGTTDRVIPTTADAIGSMNPNSKEFAALQRSFYGVDV